MMGVDAVMTTFAPSTASSSTRTPSTRMQRLPMNAPSSMMFGRAPGGSSTPPIPTPPARCTFWPTCAHEPTVAQVSTIDPGADARADVHEPRHEHGARLQEGPEPRHAARDEPHARFLEVLLQRDLVARLERPEVLGLHPGDAEVEVHRLHEPGVHLPLTVHFLRDAHLAAIQAVQRLHHGRAVGGVGQLLLVAERGRDPPLDLVPVRHSLTLRQASMASSHSSSVGTSATRTYPSPAPNAVPGATTMPSSSSRSAYDAAVCPPGTRTHR